MKLGADVSQELELAAQYIVSVRGTDAELFAVCRYAEALFNIGEHEKFFTNAHMVFELSTKYRELHGGKNNPYLPHWSACRLLGLAICSKFKHKVNSGDVSAQDAIDAMNSERYMEQALNECQDLNFCALIMAERTEMNSIHFQAMLNANAKPSFCELQKSRMMELIERVLERLKIPEVNKETPCKVLVMLANAYFGIGELQKCLQAATSVILCAEASGFRNLEQTAYLTTYLALISMDTGSGDTLSHACRRLDKAARIAREIRQKDFGKRNASVINPWITEIRESSVKQQLSNVLWMLKKMGVDLTSVEMDVMHSSSVENALCCHGCGVVPNATFMCSVCKVARYCSKECQVNAWPTHKTVCKHLHGDKS
jgi:hypothetical protein